MVTKLLLSRLRVTPDSAGKAKYDVRSILSSDGFDTVDMDNSGSHREKALRSALETPKVVRHLVRLGADDVLVCQYPLGVLGGHLASRAGKVLKVVFVHDIDSLRLRNPPEPDLRILERFDAIVVHSEPMKAWLQERLTTRPVIVVLELFDYLFDADLPPLVTADAPDKLYVAGNLTRNKVGWLYSMTDVSVPLMVYGPYAEVDKLPPDVTWSGMLDIGRPHVPTVDGFGLVWDGSSATELATGFGDYLRFNAPHKVSFYIAAGMPVIVPRQAAMAAFVEREGIGFAVSSVPEAAEMVRACSASAWRGQLAAVARLRDQVAAGHFTRRAVRAATEGAQVARERNDKRSPR